MWFNHYPTDVVLKEKELILMFFIWVRKRPSMMNRGHHGCDRVVVGFTTPCAISADHHWSCEFEPCSWRGVFDKTLCNKVCPWLATGQWFSPVSSTNKTDCHNITKMLLKVTFKHHQTNNQTINDEQNI
jgi:hypothetical protein